MCVLAVRIVHVFLSAAWNQRHENENGKSHGMIGRILPAATTPADNARALFVLSSPQQTTTACLRPWQ